MNHFIKSISFRVLLFIIIYFHSILNYAQTEKYIIQNYLSKDGLPQNSVINIQFDKQGYCWLITESGIVRFDNSKFKIFNSEQLQNMSSNRMRFITPSKLGDLYISNEKNETFLINTNTGYKSSFPIFYDTQKRIPTNKGYSVIRNNYYDSILQKEKLRSDKPFLHTTNTYSNGDLYFHNLDRLYYIHGNNHRVIYLKDSSFSHDTPLNDKYLVQIYPKNKVIIWENGNRSTVRSKLYGDIIKNTDFLSGNFRIFWTPNNVFIHADKRVYNIYISGDSILSKEVLRNIDIPNINTITYLEREKSYFIGSGTNGLFIYHPILFDYYKSTIKNNRENYNTIIKDKDGNIIANNNRFFPNGNSEKFDLINQDYPHAFINNDKIIYDGNFKLNSFDLNTRKIKVYGKLSGRLKASILHNGKYYLLESHRMSTLVNDSMVTLYKFPESLDANGMLPFSKDSAILYTTTGIYKMNYKDGKLTDHILDKIPIRFIYIENKNRWWIASDGLGASLYNYGKIIKFPKSIGKDFNSIHSFIIDKHDVFWIPTNNGLYSIERKKLLDAILNNSIYYFYHYDFRNGLRTDEFNGQGNPSFLWQDSNNLILPSINGLVKIDTHNASTILPKNGIHVEDVYIDDTLSFQSQNKINIHSGFYSLRIYLSSPYYGNSENSPIEYFISGVSKKWEKIDLDGGIHINNLPYGNYILKIRKAINDSNYQKQVNIQISILPFYYETTYFKICCILIAIGLLIFYIQLRLRYLKRRNVLIEQLVDEKTSELRNNIYSLEVVKEKLYTSNIVKERTIAIVLHDLRSPIRFISIISKDLIKRIKLDKDISPSIYDRMDALNKSLLSLEEYSIQFFSWAQSQQENFYIQNSNFSLSDLFEEVGGLYKEILQVQNNTLIVERNDIYIYTDRFILSIILRNLIDNANKNMTNGKVSINAVVFQNTININIKDTGRGMDATTQNKYRKNNKLNNKDGMGHSIIMDLLPKINAIIKIESTIDNGTLFSIIINHHQQYGIF